MKPTIPEDPPEAPVDPVELARQVESGEYYREMSNAYATVYLDPISDRYFYLAFTGMCVLIFLISLAAFSALFPLKQSIPFWYWSDDIFEERPVIRPLLAHPQEDINTAVKRYLTSEYVIRRESYDIKTLELNVRFVKAQSDPVLFDAWQRGLDPSNPESPISQFQRHSTRKIVVAYASPNQDGTVDVVYDAVVTSLKEEKKTRMVATIAFQYNNITIDQNTGVKTPLHFLVTDYRTRRQQE
jgi:type IV secretory pathway component VirB8